MVPGVGTFDGHVTFLEPMFTKALLVPGLSIEKPTRQPATYPIARDATVQEYVIALKNMMQR